jgi:rod shape-determining protein MreD
MIEVIPRYIGRFVVIVLLQIFIFNNMEFSGFVSPYIYVLFILLLPFATPASVVVLSGFLLGLSIDIFSDTIGIHTAATVLIAYIRPFVLKFFAPHDGYQSGSLPRISFYGLPWFIKYTILLVFTHHFVLFYIEMFRIQDFFYTFFRVILSSIFTVLFITLSQYFVFRK